MNDEAIVDRRVCRHDNRLRLHREIVRRDHLGTFASHSFQHLRARKNAAARSRDRRRQSAQVLQGMKLSLARKTNGAMRVEVLNRGALDQLHPEASTFAGIKFPFQIL